MKKCWQNKTIPINVFMVINFTTILALFKYKLLGYVGISENYIANKICRIRFFLLFSDYV